MFGQALTAEFHSDGTIHNLNFVDIETRELAKPLTFPDRYIEIEKWSFSPGNKPCARNVGCTAFSYDEETKTLTVIED